MAKVNLTTIKNWFKTGLKPTQTQFWSAWDSFWHKDEKIPQDSITNLSDDLGKKADNQALTAHLTDADAHSDEFAKKVDKDGDKILTDENFSLELKEKLEGLNNYDGAFDSIYDDLADLQSAIKNIVIGGNEFNYVPIVSNDGSSFQAGDIATNGWVDQNTFGKLLSYTGSGAGTGEDFDDWQIIESI